MMKRALMPMGLLLILAEPVAAQEPLAIQLITPCRYVDTRIPGCTPGEQGCRTGPFHDGETREFLVQLPDRERPIPFAARGLILTVTAVDPTADGHLLLYDAALSERPPTSSLNFQAGANTATTTFVQQEIPITRARRGVAVYARVSDGGSVHVVLDVLGYLMPSHITP